MLAEKRGRHAINSSPSLPHTCDIRDLRGAYMVLQQKHKQIHYAGLSELLVRNSLNSHHRRLVRGIVTQPDNRNACSPFEKTREKINKHQRFLKNS